MGSKCRIVTKLRQNDEYKAITRFLDDHSLKFTTHPPTGTGHPFIVVNLPNGDQMRQSIACTPKGGGYPKRAIGHLRASLREAGYDC